MKKPVQLPALLLFMTVVFFRSAEAGPTRIPLQLNEAVTGRTIPWPVSLGVPLPPDLVHNNFKARLITESGKTTPAATQATSWWQASKSVQWLNVQFIAEPNRKYFLEIGDKLKTTALHSQITAQQQDGGLFLNAGRLQARFVASSVPLQAISIDGKQVMGAQKTEAMYRFISGDGTLYQSTSPPTIDVESHNELQAIVRIRGFYTKAGEREPAARYTTRYSFFSGLPFFKVSHAFLILAPTGKGGLDFKDIQYRLPISLAEQNRSVWFDIQSSFDETVKEIEWEPGTGSLSMAQESVTHHSGGDSRFRIYRGVNEVLQETQRGGNFADVRSPNGAVTIGFKNLWQQFPAEIEVSPDTINLHLWSPRGGVLSFDQPGFERIYGETMVNFWKSSDERRFKTLEDDFARLRGQGHEKSHEIWIWPRVAAVPIDRIIEFGHLIEEPVLAMAEPKWNTASGVFGPVGVKDAVANPEIESAIDGMLNQRIEAEAVFGNYGWWAYGAGPQYTYVVKDGKMLAAPYRFFDQARYRTLPTWWMLYYRSGDRKIYQHLTTQMQRLLDLTQRHDTPEHIHGFAHTFDFGLREMVWAYSTTGDPRWKEYLDFAVEALLKYTDKERWPNWYLDDEHAGYTLSWARSTQAFLLSLVELYAYSGDERLLQRSRQLIEAMLDSKEPSGVRRSKDHMAFGEVYYFVAPFRAYAQQTNDARINDTLARLFREMYLWRTAWPLGEALSDLVEAYHLTGDERYLGQALLEMPKERLELTRRPLQELLKQDGPAKALGEPSEDKYLWEGLPRLAHALDIVRAERKIGAVLPNASRLPPLSNTVILQKRAGGVTTEITSGAALVEIEDPWGKPIPRQWWRSEVKEGYWLKKFYLAHIDIPANAPAGEYLIRGEEPLKVLSSNASSMAAWSPDGFELNPKELQVPVMLPVQPGEVTLRVRFPDKIVVHDASGKELKPLKTDGQMVTFEVPNGTAQMKVESLGETRNYVQVTTNPAGRRFATYGEDGQFLPRRNMVRFLPPTLPGKENLFKTGVDTTRPDDRALYLTENRKFVIPSSLEVDGKKIDLLPRDQGTIEFWYQPLWNPLWEPKVYYERPILHSGDLILSAAGAPANSFWNMQINHSAGYIYNNLPVTLQPGRWTHFAVSWFPWEEGDNKPVAIVYVDGQPIKEMRPKELIVSPSYPNMQRKETLTISGGPAFIDNLRISDVPRYKGFKVTSSYQREPNTFVPSRQPVVLDDNTLLLMNFDNSLKVTSAKVPALEASIQGDDK